MSQTVITAHVNDQTIQLVNQTTIASGSKGALQIQCDFDSRWNGYTKTAVFYRKESEVYHIKMTDGLATVPHEVLADEGTFFFGIMGVGENTRTTEVLRITVVQGAITTASANATEPTPNIYQQLMTAHAIMEARFENMVAKRGAAGARRIEIGDEYVRGVITTNGASAHIYIDLAGISLIEGGYHYTDYFIPPAECLKPPPAIFCPHFFRNSTDLLRRYTHSLRHGFNPRKASAPRSAFRCGCSPDRNRASFPYPRPSVPCR